MSRREAHLKRRIIAIALVGTLPLAFIALWLMHVSVNSTIEFGKQELRGNAFQRPLETVLEFLPHHQAAARNGQSTGEAAAKVDAALSELAANYRGSLGRALKFTDTELAARNRDFARLDLVLAQWDALKRLPPAEAAQTTRYSQLTAAIRALIAHSGDLSNLILDSDLDSYYLMDITLCALPQTQQRLAEITLQAGSWLRNGEAAKHQAAVAIAAALLQQSDEDRITGDAQTSLAEDKNFYGVSDSLQKNLPRAVASYRAASQDFITLLNRVAAGETVAAADLETAGWKAHTESFRLWETTVSELDRLLHTRVNHFRLRQWLNLGLVTATFAGVWILIWLILRRVDAQFAAVIAALTENSTIIAAAAGQISESSRSLAEGSSQQAGSIEQTSASLEELAAMTRQNSENTAQANQLSQATRAAAERGASDMQAMSAAMDAIKNSSDDIAKIIKTIDEIAFQTNILALNAAGEAARAGEAGMGFAVVADEVRTLAQRSAAAARETAAKIDDAIHNTARGVELSTKVAEALDGIVKKARQLDELAADVAKASQEQSHGITQINQAAAQMDKVTQGNAATAEECSAAASELNSQAQSMKRVVDELTQIVAGHTTLQAPANRAADRPFAPADRQLISEIPTTNSRQRTEVPLASVGRDH